MGRSAQPTTDHAFIKKWVEDRDGWPACVKGTGGHGDPGMIRLDFPGYEGKESLERISWDAWFEQFEERELALLYREDTPEHGQDRFNKLVSRASVEEDA